MQQIVVKKMINTQINLSTNNMLFDFVNIIRIDEAFRVISHIFLNIDSKDVFLGSIIFVIIGALSWLGSEFIPIDPEDPRKEKLEIIKS